MKGIIFNLLESFICDTWGEQAYDDILAMCPLHTREPFVGPGTYPDADLMALVATATDKLGTTPAEALHAFGRYAFGKLARKFPVFVREHSHPKPFLMTVDAVIHVEVKKFLREAEPPSIRYRDPSPSELPSELIIIYESRRQLCSLAAGLIEGCGDHFGVAIELAETACASRGASACEFQLRFG